MPLLLSFCSFFSPYSPYGIHVQFHFKCLQYCVKLFFHNCLFCLYFHSSSNKTKQGNLKCRQNTFHVKTVLYTLVIFVAMNTEPVYNFGLSITSL